MARHDDLSRVVCPECGAHGPHDDNGMAGEELTWCCHECGAHFDDNACPACGRWTCPECGACEACGPTCGCDEAPWRDDMEVE